MKKAILSTLAYGDIFNYPLTKEEIWKWLIWEERRAKREGRREREFNHWFEFVLNSCQIRVTQGFYHLPDRENIVKLRKKREAWSQQKLKLAEKVAGILREIPWIKMTGITGALAMKNSQENDDIDLLIITSRNRLWLTRFLTVFLVELFSKRRHPQDLEVKDKICLNMFLDEDHLAVPEKERDLFSAHEVLQLKPIWSRDNLYERFLRENAWVEKYLPNGIDIKNQKLNIKNIYRISKLFSFLIFLCNFTFFERLSKKFQLWYMRDRRTTEKISDGIIRFHPQDARIWVLKEYRKRLKKICQT
ncbi:MAG: hypothetical protein ACOZBZ_00700 [Patescibacteria group bacterium]